MTGVTPAIRVRDMAEALRFYTNTLGFQLTRGGADQEHCSLARGDASLMLETPSSFYGEGYNRAIRERLATPSSLALYIEAPDIEPLYERVTGAGFAVIDPLGPREWGQREFTIEDPQGNWLTFWQALEQPG